MAATKSAGIALLAVTALAGSFTAGVLVAGDSPRPQPAPRTLAAPLAPQAFGSSLAGTDLTAADSCDELLDWYVEQGLERVGPFGWDNPWIARGGPLMFDAETSAGAAVPRTAASAPLPGPVPQEATSSDTGTNVQEAGVDEPDTVKTDGTHLYRVRDGELTAYDVTGERPELVGSLELGDVTDAELLLVGDRVVVVGRDGDAPPEDVATRTLVIDVTDPAAPAVVDDAAYDTGVVAVRQHGDAVRLVLDHGLPDLDFVQPRAWRNQGSALERNRQVVRESTLEDWLPTVTRDGEDEQLLGCDQVALPDEEAGLGTLAVVGFRPDEPEALSTAGVATDSGLVYVSDDRLYLATSPAPDLWCCVDPIPAPMPKPEPVEPGPIWPPDVRPELPFDLDLPFPGRVDPPQDEPPFMPEPDSRFDPRILPPESLGGSTRLYSFALSGTGASYVASGEVDGAVADRWSMDEAGGVLRVAVGPTSRTGNFNSVVTFEEQGDALVELGRVDKLGVNETIRSVRWFDDLAFVVTFRQTDPLYAVDLTDPARPEVLGELKIPGFSEYLHPIAGDLLIGIGQDASLSGVTRGAQAALFDVSDLTDPRQVDLVTYRRGSLAGAGTDPRQFTWLPERRTALTVVSSGYAWSQGSTGWVSVLEVDGDRLENRMVEVEHGVEVAEVRTVPLPDGRVVLMTGDGVSFLDL
jgi:hypothetical protein